MIQAHLHHCTTHCTNIAHCTRQTATSRRRSCGETKGSRVSCALRSAIGHVCCLCVFSYTRTRPHSPRPKSGESPLCSVHAHAEGLHGKELRSDGDEGDPVVFLEAIYRHTGECVLEYASSCACVCSCVVVHACVSHAHTRRPPAQADRTAAALAEADDVIDLGTQIPVLRPKDGMWLVLHERPVPAKL